MEQRQVLLYDTSLRDGMQGQGMSLSAQEKVRVVRKLDELGIHLIEAGFPGSNPKELELFERLADVELRQAAVCAFGMTRRRDLPAEEDEGLQVLAGTFAPVVTLVGKTWKLHLDKVTKVSPGENLEMIRDSISFLRARGKRVIYDAEHFFDGWREDPGYARECLLAAAEGGAENVSLCDTNGSSLPAQIAEATSAAIAELSVDVGIHTHNDLGCGVANSLAAVERGASLVQGTINGIGERTGNANLTSILPALQVKMGLRVVSQKQLGRLTETAHFMDELLNVNSDPDQPFVGRNAFAHKGGMHVAGVNADARTFEHMDPELVGNRRDLVVSELSGKGTVLSRAEQAGLSLDAEEATRALRTLKEREHRGYQYEAAPASFELLLRRESGSYEPLFRLESFRVITDKREDGKVQTEATIKVWVEGERYVRTAEGNGPVNALDAALRDAITDRHPHLAEIELTNYKVRILDEHHGTGAVTRVLLDSSDGEREWGSTGVSENIIEASWEALVDSLEYAFQPDPDSSTREPGSERSRARSSGG
ncbi:MAG: citramalate synthase [Actinobacteria bacterium]|nr:citramalate synthase [Actinomycetota bacterium]